MIFKKQVKLIKYVFMPVKLIIIIIGLIILPLGVTVEWSTDAYDNPWDEHCLAYLKKLVSII